MLSLILLVSLQRKVHPKTMAMKTKNRRTTAKRKTTARKKTTAKRRTTVKKSKTMMKKEAKSKVITKKKAETSRMKVTMPTRRRNQPASKRPILNFTTNSLTGAKNTGLMRTVATVVQVSK